MDVSSKWPSVTAAAIHHSSAMMQFRYRMAQICWLRTKVRKQTYTYEYSFDGENYKEIPVTLDASILSDDYVLQSYGGFFTGAFVGMACVDYAGYNTVAEFRSFDYKEYED